MAVCLANVHRPNSLQATDCGLYFSSPLSLINGCSDKQTWRVKGSSTRKGRRDDEGVLVALPLTLLPGCLAFLAGVVLQRAIA